MTDEPMVERLTALEAAATPGPWESFVDFGNQESHVRTPKWSASLGLAARTADAALIVAMRNDLPALLSQLREQEERADYWQRLHAVLNESSDRLGPELMEARNACTSLTSPIGRGRAGSSRYCT